MNGLMWVAAALALFEAGWMLFDGSRALIKGDYVTPKSGTYAGRLGPWSKIVKAIGLEPRSTLMKSIFVVYGFVWLIIIMCFVLQLSWARWGLLIAAIGALWYLPIGTLLSTIQIILLLLP